MRTVRFEELEKRYSIRRKILRILMEYRQSSSARVGKRDIGDTLRLAILAVEASKTFISVVSWNGRRILRVR